MLYFWGFVLFMVIVGVVILVGISCGLWLRCCVRI